MDGLEQLMQQADFAADILLLRRGQLSPTAGGFGLIRLADNKQHLMPVYLSNHLMIKMFIHRSGHISSGADPASGHSTQDLRRRTALNAHFARLELQKTYDPERHTQHYARKKYLAGQESAVESAGADATALKLRRLLCDEFRYRPFFNVSEDADTSQQ